MALIFRSLWQRYNGPLGMAINWSNFHRTISKLLAAATTNSKYLPPQKNAGSYLHLRSRRAKSNFIISRINTYLFHRKRVLMVKTKCCPSTTIQTYSSTPHIVGRDSSDVTATRYGLNGPGIESRWRRDFPQLSRPVLGSTQPPIQYLPGKSRG